MMIMFYIRQGCRGDAGYIELSLPVMERAAACSPSHLLPLSFNRHRHHHHHHHHHLCHRHRHNHINRHHQGLPCHPHILTSSL